jgi:hypothetical protein
VPSFTNKHRRRLPRFCLYLPLQLWCPPLVNYINLPQFPTGTLLFGFLQQFIIIMEAFRESDFPHYRDGDVAITIAPLKTYQLHSNVLRRNSRYFAEILDETTAAPLTTKARRDGVTTQYRLQLVKPTFDAIGTFQRVVSKEWPPCVLQIVH